MMPSLQAQNRQQHTVTPRLQHAVRLLQLSSLDFAQEVHDAMGRNPFLEVEDSPHDVARADSAAGGDDADPRGIDLDAGSPMADAPYERDSWQQTSSSVRQQNHEGDIGALDLIPADVGLRQHLRSQINVLPLDERDHALACAVVESLDDDGYLRISLDELSQASGMSPPVEDVELQIALRRVQSFDPAGVGARNVSECLLLQMDAIDCPKERALASAIVVEQLDRLAQHDVNGLARLLKRTPLEIEAACERIRHLNPRPGWNVEPTTTQYITPDVIVRKIRGRWTATLNRAVVPRVKLNQEYAALFKEHRDAQHGELAQHLQEARWTVKNVQQRFSTILTVADAILKRQHHFLEFGPMAMKPLGLREIAEELGLPSDLVWRQPFPGPGLAIRIVGEVSAERLSILRAADAIAREELTAAGLDRDIWQCPVVLLAGVRSVGVQGDGRSYGHPIVLRPVSSEDAMTADWTRVPYDVLARISTRITNEVSEVNRVVLDVTSKPPGTIEWE